jgi:putative spermidine/putrescine transport system substrate-binding protein
MNTNKKTALAALCAITITVAACSGETQDQSSSPTSNAPATSAFTGPITSGEGELRILAWPGYAENGTNDPQSDWVTPFTDATGCAVTVREIGSSDEAADLMATGEWDVVSASGDITGTLITEQDVQPINTELLINYDDLIPALRGQQWNTQDGTVFGVPHGRAANILAFNPREISPAPTSWGITWNSSSAAAGRVTAYDSPIYIADAALYLMSKEPELGITNPYALDETQFAAAIELLRKQQRILLDYWSGFDRQVAELTSGEVVVTGSWQVIANAVAAGGGSIDSVKPKEGATGWSDSWMIGSRTPHINCAYKWIDWITSPAVNAQAAEFFGEAPANPLACAETKNPDHCSVYFATAPKYWSDVYFWTTPSASCLDGRTDVACVPYSEWQAAWSALREGFRE